MTAATTLLDELRQLGATCEVVDGALRIAVPKAKATPELRRLVADHRDELRQLLERTLPAPDPRRLTLTDCAAALAAMHTELRAIYPAGALALLDVDADLKRRFDASEARIDDLARTPGGPLDADFRAAVDGHVTVWRELIGRVQAKRDHRG